MKKKNIAIVLLCAVILAPAVFLLLDFAIGSFSLNFQKIHTFTADKLTFEFYGSFESVGKLKIREGGKNICTLYLSADADTYKKNADAVILADINSDGDDDLLVLTELDSDGDAHRIPYLYSEGKYKRMGNMTLSNPRMEKGILICEERTFGYLAETREDYTVPYNIESKKTEYTYSEWNIIPKNALYVTYYSESQIYCVGRWEYNENLGELMSTSEDWLDAKEYKEAREELAKEFKISLPE